MPRTPQTTNLNTAVSPDNLINPVLNEMSANNASLEADLNIASMGGRAMVFTGTNQSAVMSSIHAIGDVIMNNDTYRNAFLNTLWNRIGRVIITNKLWSNPWKPFKKGLIEFGETIEEIFVEMANPHMYDAEEAESKLFKRELPDIKAAFHSLNYRKMYKTTIQNQELRQAFLSWSGISELIARIIDSLYDGAEYDEFLVMKYLLCRLALDGFIHTVEIPAVSASTSDQVVTIIKSISDKWEFKSNLYNFQGVRAYSKKATQNVILDTDTSAVVDVNSLASAFNLPYKQFLGKRVLVDGWGETDTARLSQIFAGDPAYIPFSSTELAELDKIKVIMVDDNFFMIFDNLQEFDQAYNPQGLYWNYFFHVWQTFSASPFNNATIFAVVSPSVTSIAINPTSSTLSPGASMIFKPDVVTSGFASKGVTWNLEGAESSDTKILSDGTLIVSQKETATNLLIKITSVFNPSMSATATVTVTP